MSETLRLLRVFLASPSDLVDERIAARDAIREVNELVARPAHYQVDLVGWEDTISEARRPQAVINDELDQCDIFIGMLFARWGTPPDNDGTFSSGFEEEFVRSRERRDRTGRPDIKLFFKTVDDARLVDIGPELQKVLDFKAALIEEKSVFFQPFDTSSDFARLLRAAVSSHIHRLVRESAGEADEDLSQAPKAEISDATLSSRHDTGENAPDADFLQFIAEKLPEAEEQITAPEIARLRLIGASIATSGNTEAGVGVHDANLLYADCDPSIFSQREVRTLLDAGLGGISYENVPVWRWLSLAIRRDPIALEIRTVIGEDSNRVGAIETLRLLGQKIEGKPPFARDWITQRWFYENASSAIKNAALRYLAALGTPEDLEIVEREIEFANSQTVRAAIEAAIRIKLRIGGQDALRFALTTGFETLDEAILAQVLSFLPCLDAAELRPGLDHRSPIVRAAVLAQLGERNLIDRATALRAASDDSTMVRIAAIRILDSESSMSIAEITGLLSRPKRSGLFLLLTSGLDEEGIAAVAEIKRQRLMRADLNTVSGIADGKDPDRDIAWMVRADRNFSVYSEELRHHIDDRFLAYHVWRWADEREDPALRGAGTNALLGLAPAADIIRRRNLLRSGLDILLKRREKKDLPRLRKLIDDDGMPLAAEDAHFLGEMGSWEDVFRLGAIGSKSSGGLLSSNTPFEKPAVAAILRLARGREEELISADLPDNILSMVIASIPGGLISKWNDASVDTLLRHTEENVRRVSAIKFIRAFARRRSINTLNRYLNSELDRYYNVIFWLDLARSFPRATTKAVAELALREGKIRK